MMSIFKDSAAFGIKGHYVSEFGKLIIMITFTGGRRRRRFSGSCWSFPVFTLSSPSLTLFFSPLPCHAIIMKHTNSPFVYGCVFVRKILICIHVTAVGSTILTSNVMHTRGEKMLAFK